MEWTEEQSALAILHRYLRLRGFPVVILVACFAATQPAAGQRIGKQTGCYAASLAANPNRPTVANPADITQYGVLELEYGWDQVWPGEGVQQASLGGLLKFGMLCDLELRWNSTAFLSQSDTNGTYRSFGDTWLGPQLRFYRQTKRVPSLALSYAAKIPSASTDDGLGSGYLDHEFTFLASKDIVQFHLDFNASQFLIGRSQGGFDQNQQFNLAFSHVIHGKLQFTGEFYGDTQLNQTQPGFASSLWAMTYSVLPRLVVDGGYESGLTSGGPRRHAFAGATYSIGNLYRGRRH